MALSDNIMVAVAALTRGLSLLQRQVKARAPLVHTHDAADVVSGVFDAGRVPALPMEKVTGLATTLDGKQALDSDLTAIAELTTTAYGRGLLTLANVAALKTSLSLVKADVGLGNVDNTADSAKPVSTAQQTALNLKADISDTIVSVTTGRDLAATDNGKVLEVNSASAVTLTVPSTLPVGFNCIVSQVGAGQVTVAAGTSATVTAYQGAKTPGQWGEIAVRVRGTAGVAVVSGGVA